MLTDRNNILQKRISIMLINFFDFFQHLTLSSNVIYKIDEQAFTGLHALRILDISHNLLVSAPSIIDVKDTLETLDLSWNKLSIISESYFDSCNYMKSIIIAGNQLSIMPNIKGASTTLRQLVLASNNISDAKPLHNIRLPYLRSLDLHSNQIDNFCFPSMIPYLDVVSLSSNRLSYLHFSQLNVTWSQMIHVFLKNNPWHCNGSLGWTKNCIAYTNDYMLCMGWFLTEPIMCTSPRDVQGLTATEAGKYILLHSGNVLEWILITAIRGLFIIVLYQTPLMGLACRPCVIRRHLILCVSHILLWSPYNTQIYIVHCLDNSSVFPLPDSES